MPWKILIPHSTTTMADTSVAAVNTLSKEATLMTHSASYPASGLIDSAIPRQSCGYDCLNVVDDCGLLVTYLDKFPNEVRDIKSSITRSKNNKRKLHGTRALHH
jgi:hypothetical protein